MAQLRDLQVEDLEKGFLTPGPDPFLLHLSHKAALGECSGSTLDKGSAEVLWEPRPGGYLPDLSDVVNRGLSAPHSSWHFLAVPGDHGLRPPSWERLHFKQKRSGPRAVTLSPNVLVPAGVLWLAL